MFASTSTEFVETVRKPRHQGGSRAIYDMAWRGVT